MVQSLAMTSVNGEPCFSESMDMHWRLQRQGAQASWCLPCSCQMINKAVRSQLAASF